MSDLVPPAAIDGGGNEPIPELMRLGELLIQAREGAGLSQEALAERLRIEPRLLKALEQGNHGQLPEGVFVVAMARRIASSLQADLEEAIDNVRRSRLMAPRAPGPAAASPGEPTRAARSPQTSPPAHRHPQRSPAARPSLPWLWPLAALLAICGGVGGWLALSRRPPETSPAPALAPRVQPARPKNPAADSASTLRLQASEPSWVDVRDAEGQTVFQGTLTGEKQFPLGRGLRVMAGRPYAVKAAIGPGPVTALGGVDDIRWQWFRPEGLQPKAAPSSSPSP